MDRIASIYCAKPCLSLDYLSLKTDALQSFEKSATFQVPIRPDISENFEVATDVSKDHIASTYCAKSCLSLDYFSLKTDALQSFEKSATFQDPIWPDISDNFEFSTKA